MTYPYPPIKNYDASFSYYEGIAAAMVILATDCSQPTAESAVAKAVKPHKGERPTARLACSVILDAVATVRGEE